MVHKRSQRFAAIINIETRKEKERRKQKEKQKEKRELIEEVD
jgi:hypothetical protein